MSKADGDNFDPLDFDLPEDDVTSSSDEPEMLDDSEFAEEPASAEGLEDLEEAPAEDEEAEEPTTKRGKKKKKKKEKKPKAKKQKKQKKEKIPKPRKPKREATEAAGMADFLIWGICALSVVAVLAIDAMIFSSRGSASIAFIIVFTIIWLIGTSVPFLLWNARRTSSPFVVFLGVSLVGLVIATLLLWVELSTYGGDIGAKGAWNIHAPPAAQSAPEIASATA